MPGGVGGEGPGSPGLPYPDRRSAGANAWEPPTDYFRLLLTAYGPLKETAGAAYCRAGGRGQGGC